MLALALRHVYSGNSISIPNENNFNTQTIAFYVIPNGGIMRFRSEFLNWVVEYLIIFDRNDTRKLFDS
jgi:hypothetical protein